MAKFVDYVIDSEAMEFANRLVDKFDERLGHIDLSKVCFVREKGKSAKGKVIKTSAVKYPMDIDSPYVYYITINETLWVALDDSQKAINIFEQLCSIEIGGTDTQSAGYAKKQRPQVVRFIEAMNLTDGEYDYDNGFVKNILD
jgi:hypothetical protein